MLTLQSGAVRVLVKSGVRCTIKTETATIECKGTDFVAIYDPDKRVTKVIGIAGTVQLGSSIARLGGVQLVSAREMTTVRRGQRPSRPEALDEATFRQYVEGFEFIGGGRPESTTVDHPLLAGNALPREDVAPLESWATAPPGEPPYRPRSPAEQLRPPFSPLGDLGIEF